MKAYTRILVVDDEKDIVDLLSYNLRKENYDVVEAFNGETALDLISEKNPHLVLLDLMLPGIQGQEICSRLRKNPETAFLPIIMITAKKEEIDKVLGLELGADDYITKPFSIKEVLARVKAVLRRSKYVKPLEIENVIEYRGLRIDLRSYEVFMNNRRLTLSSTEFKVLKFLAQNPRRVFTRDQILDSVWSNNAFVEARTVDVHISRLRNQIETDPQNPKYILTVRGIGYKFL